MLVRYIHELGTVNPSADGNWRLAPTTGNARLVFETGPAARAHAETRTDVSYLDTAANGFARFVLRPVA